VISRNVQEQFYTYLSSVGYLAVTKHRL